MSVNTPEIKTAALEKFQRLYELQASQLNGRVDAEWRGLKERALERLLQKGFPTRKDEDWKYTSVTRMVNQSFVPADAESHPDPSLRSLLPPPLSPFRVVLVNGVFSKEWSSLEGLPEGVEILPLPESHTRFPELLPAVEELGLEKGNAFTFLNLSLASRGLLVHLNTNASLDQPLEVLHILQCEEQPVLAMPQVLFSLERGSRLSVVERHLSVGEGQGGLSAPFNLFLLKANARMEHCKVQALGKGAFQVNQSAAVQDRDSVFSSWSVDLGGQIVRNNLSAHLKASNTETNLFGVYLVSEGQHLDNQTFIDHAFPHCQSNELYKGLIAGKGRGVFNGKVLVRPDAQKTNAFQQNNTVLLTPDAVMDSKPQLEIFADDVRCSHGATIGQLDESALFYLRSRGLSRLQALQMLQEAFLGEVLDGIPTDAVRDALFAQVRTKLNELKA